MSDLAGGAAAGPTAGSIGTAAEAPVGDMQAARPLRADVWRRFRRNKLAVTGFVFIVLLILVAIFAPLIAPFSITERTGEIRQGPTSGHLFGTDRIGRDVFSRVVFGARVSLKVGILATMVSLIIGVLAGAVAGFLGGFVETVVMRVTDIFLAIPYIILAVAIATVLGRGENTVIVVLGLTGWLAICRIVRSSFLSLRQLEYVEAATALGAGKLRIMFRHILPNALQPIIVYGTIAVGSAILAEAALSFLGVGAVEPTPAWGLMVDEGRGDLVNAPHLLYFPGGAIFLTVLAFQFVGDGLRDALDPRLR
ncbi:MAG: binding-protein-dependent transport system inner rane component [Acidimicrobiales bacterium]|nr:binding-protein-dependent transport system inner rane component [Acidimicrobiales bacterium]